jgi:hypothetical protein
MVCAGGGDCDLTSLSDFQILSHFAAAPHTRARRKSPAAVHSFVVYAAGE